MGHDITAYLGKIAPTALDAIASDGELGEEIAYLRGRYGIYEALDATFYDAKVSGNGLGRWFTRVQLECALRRLADREIAAQFEGYSVEPAMRFVRDCLQKVPRENDVCYIDFG